MEELGIGKIIGLIVVGFLSMTILLGVVGFIATGGDLATYKFWAPKRANAEREVFQNTQSYVQGKQEYLSKLKYEYQTATSEQSKDALRSLIISEASTVDLDKLSPDLQAFVHQIRGE